MGKNIAVITGASSGMGLEFALQIDWHVRAVDEIWMIARRKERLENLSRMLRKDTKILSLDLSKEQDLEEFHRVLKEEKPKVRLLINCAGLGFMGPFAEIPLKEQLQMVDVNVRSLTDITYSCLPYMGKNSRIIQLASSAAFLPQKNFAVYAATKSYVLSLSRALSEELRKKKIYVTSVCPGPVETEFFPLAGKYGDAISIKEKVMVSAEQVVAKALRDSGKKKQISVCSLPIKAFFLLTKIVPHKWIFFVMRFMK